MSQGRGGIKTLHTIGYQGRSLEEFVRLLRASGIDALVDVRDVPWSHKPGFSKKPLSEALAKARVAYVPAPFAGNPKSLRSSVGTTEDALRLYAGHLDAEPEIVAKFDTLIEDLLEQGKRPCLLCFEDDPAACHRTILAERWAGLEEGRSVRHLRFAKR